MTRATPPPSRALGLTLANVDTSDPRALAEALRRACFDLDGKTPKCSFAAALLAVLDECNKWLKPSRSPALSAMLGVSENIIRAAARAWLDHGGTLPGKAGEGEG